MTDPGGPKHLAPSTRHGRIAETPARPATRTIPTAPNGIALAGTGTGIPHHRATIRRPGRAIPATIRRPGGIIGAIIGFPGRSIPVPRRLRGVHQGSWVGRRGRSMGGRRRRRLPERRCRTAATARPAHSRFRRRPSIRPFSSTRRPPAAITFMRRYRPPPACRGHLGPRSPLRGGNFAARSTTPSDTGSTTSSVPFDRPRPTNAATAGHR